MPIEEPIQNLPAPINSDPPDGPAQIAAVNAATVDRLNMRFASVAARDAALPNPVDGMEATTGSGVAAEKWARVNGEWLRVWSATPRRQSGTVAISYGGSNTAAVQVDFPVPFTGAGNPDVIATYGDGFTSPRTIVAAYNPSNTGFTARIMTADGSTHAGTRSVFWVAFKD